MISDTPLPAPARYFPFENGVYEVAPGLKPLGTSYGNGEADGRLFQIDAEFGRYRQNKLACRSERLGKYCATSKFNHETAKAVNRFLIERLLSEYPQWFQRIGAAELALKCRLTDEELIFDADFELKRTRSREPLRPPYASAFDALCSQIQEDIAIMQVAPDRTNWLSAVHVCGPSHWSGEDKLGKDFIGIHAPIPGIEKVNRAAAPLVDAMVHRGPFVRFVWMIAGNRRLNCHPIPPPGIADEDWNRKLCPERGFVLRVERQVIWGLPEASASVFAIRVSFIDGEEVRSDPRRRAALRSAVMSMSPESRIYKSVGHCFDELMRCLDA